MIYGASRMCKGCGRSIIVYTTLQTLCMACSRKNYKPIPKRGKRAKEYDVWRDKIAKPYLDKRYGHVCAKRGCNVTEGLEVDHKKGRGSHPELKYQVTNLQYLCFTHHREKTEHKT